MKHKIRRYYIPDPALPILTRAAMRLTRRPVPDFPRTVQLETQTGCNADCVFCDYGISYPKQPKGTIDQELFRRIVDECAAHDVRRFSPYLTNEPFADRELLDRIRYVNTQMPRTKVVITTNAHYLVPSLTDRVLALEKPLHAIYVSMQGIEKEAYEAAMRGNMSFERTMENVDYLIGRIRHLSMKRPEIWITMVDTRGIDAPAALAYWKRRGVKAKFTTLDNRGGSVEGIPDLGRSGKMSPYLNCPRLMKQAYIHFDGDVVLCCVDNSRKVVLGNLRESTLREVWNGEKAMAHRRRYIAGDLEGLELCGTCRVDDERVVSNV